MSRLYLLVLFLLLSCVADNECIVDDKSNLTNLVVHHIGDYSLIDVRPAISDDNNPTNQNNFELRVCFFGLSDFTDFITDKKLSQINPSNEKNIAINRFLNSNVLHCNNDKGVRFDLQELVFQEQCQDFFNDKSELSLIKTLKCQSNSAYKTIVESSGIITYDAQSLNFVMDNSKFSMSNIFKNTINSCYRFYLCQSSDNRVCATIGVAPYTIAKAEWDDGEHFNDAYDFLPSSSTVFIDYLVFKKFRGNNLGNIALEKTLQVIFGEDENQTLVTNVLLNIRKNIIPSLSIAYSHGFRALREEFPNEKNAQKDKINYILTKEDYFKNKNDILNRNFKRSKVIESLIEQQENNNLYIENNDSSIISSLVESSDSSIIKDIDSSLIESYDSSIIFYNKPERLSGIMPKTKWNISTSIIDMLKNFFSLISHIKSK